jgi:hypothetical protein
MHGPRPCPRRGGTSDSSHVSFLGPHHNRELLMGLERPLSCWDSEWSLQTLFLILFMVPAL